MSIRRSVELIFGLVFVLSIASCGSVTMTNGKDKSVDISVSGGKPVATPNSIQVRKGEQVVFTPSGGVTCFCVEFNTNGTPFAQNAYCATKGAIRATVTGDPDPNKEYKYDVLVMTDDGILKEDPTIIIVH